MKSSLLTILQTAAWAMALPAMEAGARAGQRKAARRKAAPGRTIGWMEMLRKLAPAGLLLILAPGAVRASTTLSYSDTYGGLIYTTGPSAGSFRPFENVSLSFSTSLTGAQLDNLCQDDITSTVTDFHYSLSRTGLRCLFVPPRGQVERPS